MIAIEYLFLSLSVVSGSAKSAFSKLLSPYSKTSAHFGFTNTVLSLTAAMILYLLNGGNVDTDHTKSILLGILFGICTTAAQYFYMRAMAHGAVSVVTFIYSCGFLLPTFAGTLFWSEPLKLPVIGGCLLLLFAFFLCGRKTDSVGAKKQRSSGCIGYPLIAMICSGLLGVLQKVHQTSAERAETGTFLVIAFLVSALLSAVIALCGKTHQTDEKLPLARVSLLSCICGAFVGTANQVNLILSGALPAATVFPITNGGVVVLSALVGHVVFRERLSSSALSGILLGIVSIIIIGLNK